jgi:hypothetical protein
MNVQLRLRFFGPFAISTADAWHPGPPSKNGGKLIQYLGVYLRRVATAEDLALAFWPHCDVYDVRHRVHLAASGARVFRRHASVALAVRETDTNIARMSATPRAAGELHVCDRVQIVSLADIDEYAHKRALHQVATRRSWRPFADSPLGSTRRSGHRDRCKRRMLALWKRTAGFRSSPVLQSASAHRPTTSPLTAIAAGTTALSRCAPPTKTSIRRACPSRRGS